MPSTFQNPRNPFAALWASAVEKQLRDQNPDLSIQQIRQLPMMQGVYEHLSQLKEKKRVAKPPTGAAAKEADQASSIAQSAYLSQAYFDLAVTTAGFATLGEQKYDTYISLLQSFNDTVGIADFSTNDVIGFGLCFIVWMCMTGELSLSEKVQEVMNLLIDYMIDNLHYTADQRKQIRDLWNKAWNNYNFDIAYRKKDQYPNYKEIPWKIPDDAQIVMLGDWGTSLTDAHEFLRAIWRKAYQNDPGKTIVFLHLGDIYYCGLPWECRDNFYEVFVNIGKDLQSELGSNFNPTPPIFTLPGNHEYYSYGYGYFELLDVLNYDVPGISHDDLYQQCSFFCLQTENGQWQFLGMDTGRDDCNALLSLFQLAAGVVKGFIDLVLPDFGWLSWANNMAKTAYDDFAGPFQPTLDDGELDWHKQRLKDFGGTTIMLSHHQLFSHSAKINHSNPEYMNGWLDKTFDEYYKHDIAAWYWGHEHAFAVYMDGVMGLNKGRLLGSSSYEATSSKDDPYEDKYYMIPYAKNMKVDLVHKNANGLYYHTGAIMSQVKNQDHYDMMVKYYQFPAWTQLDSTPDDLSLDEITEVAETITTSFTTLMPTWVGDVAINENDVTTDHSPSITTWNDLFYMVYADNGNNQNKLTACIANMGNYDRDHHDYSRVWSAPVSICINGENIVTKNSPAVIAVNDKLYVFFLDSNSQIRGVATEATGQLPENWSLLNSSGIKAGDAALAVCFFQGRIYILYLQPNKVDDYCWAYYDIEENAFHDLGEMRSKDKNDQFASSNTPALAADAYRMYMVYQQAQKSDIRWAVGTPTSDAPEGTSNNIDWDDKQDIKSVAGTDKQKGTVEFFTDSGMTLQYANNLFFLVFASTDDHHPLVQCALNGVDQDNTGEWIGDNQVTANKNTHASTARSSKAPALSVGSEGALLVYRGENHDEIYWAYY